MTLSNMDLRRHSSEQIRQSVDGLQQAALRAELAAARSVASSGMVRIVKSRAVKPAVRITAPAASAEMLKPPAKTAGKKLTASLLGAVGLTARAGKFAYDNRAPIMFQAHLMALSGLALLTVPLGTAPERTAPAVQILDSSGDSAFDLSVAQAYTPQQVAKLLEPINELRFALGGPVQQKKIDNVRSAEKALAKTDAALAQLADAMKTQQANIGAGALDAQQRAAAEKRLNANRQQQAGLRQQYSKQERQLASLPQPIPTDKLLVMNGAAAAAVLIPRTVFSGPMRTIALPDLFARMIGHAKIESRMKGDIAYSEKPNGAIGPVQLLPTTYLPLFVKHQDQIVLPESERGIYDPLKRAVGAMISEYAKLNAGKTVPFKAEGKVRNIKVSADHPVEQIKQDADLMRLAYRDAKLAYQVIIRHALRDPTPLIVMGRQTTRGIYLSMVLYQHYQDEQPALPADMVRKFGVETIAYNFWQLGPDNARKLFKHYRILKTYDKNGPQITAAANCVEKAKELIKADDARIAGLNKQLKAAHPKQAKKVSPVKGKKAVPVKDAKQGAKSAVGKATPRPLTQQERQLTAQIADVKKHRAQQVQQQTHWQTRLDKLQAPWNSYVKDLGGQAQSNKDIWLENGHMKMPADALAYIQKRLLGKIPDAARSYARMGFPVLAEVNHRLVLQPPQNLQTAVRPSSMRISYSAAPKPRA